VQQCLSHMLRHLQDVTDIDPAVQAWTVQAADALRVAIHAFNLARRQGVAIDPHAITAARKKFDQAVACGISINLSRPWPKGNHPGLVLARRLKRKATQVWLFTTRGDVPPTNDRVSHCTALSRSVVSRSAAWSGRCAGSIVAWGSEFSVRFGRHRVDHADRT
jgi:hypothetical protein